MEQNMQHEMEAGFIQWFLSCFSAFDRGSMDFAGLFFVKSSRDSRLEETYIVC